MKGIIIFAVLCLVAVGRADQDTNYKAVDECMRELNIPFAYRHHLGIRKGDDLKYPDEALCMRACYYRKWFQTTLYNGFMLIVKEVNEKAFLHTNYTREDVVSKINECHETEPVECKFFKCIDPFKGPVADLLF